MTYFVTLGLKLSRKKRKTIFERYKSIRESIFVHSAEDNTGI